MLEKYLFPVEKQKIYHDEYESGFSKVVRADNNKLISVVTDNYLLIENKEIYSHLLENFGELKMMNDFSFSNDRYSSMSFELPFEAREVEVGDTVSAMLRIENSYDTTKSLTVSINAMRLVCSNGMIVNDSIYQSKTKHIGDKNVDDIISEMMLSIGSTAERSFEQTVVMFTKMKSKKLTKTLKEQFVKSLAEYPQFFSKIVTDEIIRTNPNNLWELYNCVTYACTHKLKRNIHSTVKTEDSVNNKIISLI